MPPKKSSTPGRSREELPKVNVTVRIREDLLNQVDALAKESDSDRTFLVTTALKALLKKGLSTTLEDAKGTQ
jgi:predicted transcriptional regulator